MRTKKLKEDLEAKEKATFKPAILKYGNVRQSTEDRCLQLYARVLPGYYAKKQDVTTDDIEWQRQENECTYVPKITNYNPRTVDLSEIKGIDTTLSKMNTARAER
jgi:hypothetical protein